MIRNLPTEIVEAIARCNPDLILDHVKRATLFDVDGIRIVFDIAKECAEQEKARREKSSPAGLLACPFCGKPFARVCEIPSEDDYKFIVRCDWCHASTSPRNNHVVCKEDWNTRYDT